MEGGYGLDYSLQIAEQFKEAGAAVLEQSLSTKDIMNLKVFAE
jgi:hypothetical protein